MRDDIRQSYCYFVAEFNLEHPSAQVTVTMEQKCGVKVDQAYEEELVAMLKKVQSRPNIPSRAFFQKIPSRNPVPIPNSGLY